MDGYGVMHYGRRQRRNGPTYNSYGQSFQYNPSMPRPVRAARWAASRRGQGMGGFGGPSLARCMARSVHGVRIACLVA